MAIKATILRRTPALGTHRVHSSNAWPAQSRWDTCAEVLLIALLAFMPLALGADKPWSELVVLIVTGVLAAIVALRLTFDRQRRFVWSWTYLPVVLFVLLAVAHLA